MKFKRVKTYADKLLTDESFKKEFEQEYKNLLVSDKKIIVGDIFQSEAQTLINAVNCVGVMGKGIALEFKNRFPEMYEDYVSRCARKEVKLGEPYLFHRATRPQIINFPTKDHWKALSRIKDIEQGLKYLLAHYKEWGVTYLAIPALGCGNGQLEWSKVKPLIHKYIEQIEVPVEVCAPKL
jgi:O-acetyl-ADP-ribose deacetylase (regulator of RNase III)